VPEECGLQLVVNIAGAAGGAIVAAVIALLARDRDRRLRRAGAKRTRRGDRRNLGRIGSDR